MTTNYANITDDRLKELLAIAIKYNGGFSKLEIEELKTKVKEAVNVEITENKFINNGVPADLIKAYSKKDERKIAILESDSDYEKKFSIAHECAHFMLDHQAKHFFRSSDPAFTEDPILKNEANRLGAMLLVPTKDLTARYNDSNDILSDYFKVELEVIRRRKEEVLKEFELIVSLENFEYEKIDETKLGEGFLTLEDILK